MTAKPLPPNARPGRAAPSDLRFDPQNPRLLGAAGTTEPEAIEFLLDDADVQELVTSIALSGWFDLEPLIILEHDNLVLEGNRRLAALRLLADATLRSHLGVTLPDDARADALPGDVAVLYVSTRSQARDFIGFKHVNGPNKWDSLAKAKFAWQWLQDEAVAIEDVARRLGDAHNTVARLVNGYTVLTQAEQSGFDREKRTKKRFAFSHLYTILARPAVRDFLGITEPVSAKLEANPVCPERTDDLLQLMTWLYGQGDDQPTIIQSQNPNLNQLTDVLGNKTAVAALKSGRDLETAHAYLENKATKFNDAIFALQSAVDDAARVVGGYEYDVDVHAIAHDIQRSVGRLLAAMNEAKREAVHGLADAS
jgi:hypothetical protein